MFTDFQVKVSQLVLNVSCHKEGVPMSFMYFTRTACDIAAPAARTLSLSVHSIWLYNGLQQRAWPVLLQFLPVVCVCVMCAATSLCSWFCVR